MASWFPRSTTFRDRGEEIRLHPLSFAEFRQVARKDEYSAFREYLVYGGMPLCVLKRTETEKRAAVPGRAVLGSYRGFVKIGDASWG